jgi:hypothetical protein
MSEKPAGRRDGARDIDEDPPGKPLPEPIYDLTTADKTELVKAAGPRERGEED